MAIDSEGGGSSDGLDFDRVEKEADGGGEGAQLSCAGCQREISDRYFTLGETILCDECRHRHEMQEQNRSGAGPFVKAGVFGLAAAVAGAAIWGGIIWITEYELGIIAIIVGLMVGGAVKAGTGGRGGRLYQVMAVLLTYLSVTLAYVPLVARGLSQEFQETKAGLAEPSPADEATPVLDEEYASAEGEAAPGAGGEAGINIGDVFDPDVEASTAELVIASIAIFVAAAALPFLAGFENIIGLLIIGFALWEAWKINRRVELALAGPFQVGGA